MALVIFGFMWLNKPDEEARQAKEAEKEQAQAAAKADEATPVVNPFTDGEIATIARNLSSASTANADGSRHFANGTVDLNFTDDTITGQVYVNDLGNWVDVADVLANRIEGIYGAELARAANVTLREAIKNAAANGPMSRFTHGSDTIVTLGGDNALLRVGIASHGGAIVLATLNDYNSEVGEHHAVSPFNGGNGTYNFVLRSASNQFNTRDLYFTPYVIDDNTLEMRLDFDADTYWGIRYTLKPDSYVVGMEVIQSGMGSILGNAMADIKINWRHKLVRNEVGKTFEERNSAIYYKYVGESPDNLSEASTDSKELTEPVKWVAFKNQFFSTVMIPRGSFKTAKLNSWIINDNAAYLKLMEMEATAGYTAAAESPVAFDIYIGPNLYPLLSDLSDTIAGDEDLQLTRLIPLGWALFRWINTLIIIPVFTFLGSFITNYGVVILLLTIFIRLILFPFTYKSYRSQAKMRLLSPEIKEINDKYPGQDNAMKRQQETMALYSKAGASPFAGCLPMLLQMPVLIAMFYFLPNCIELREQSFLWAHDLSAPDYIFTLPFSISWYGDRVSLFCLLMTATNIIYTRINMQNQPSSSSMPGMKWMMYLMPVIFLFFFNDYASGLSYYYFLSLLLTIMMTWVFRRTVDEDKLRAEMKSNAAKPRKKSGFMARLEEAQRQQQAMLREQQKRKGGRR